MNGYLSRAQPIECSFRIPNGVGFGDNNLHESGKRLRPDKSAEDGCGGVSQSYGRHVPIRWPALRGRFVGNSELKTAPHAWFSINRYMTVVRREVEHAADTK